MKKLNSILKPILLTTLTLSTTLNASLYEDITDSKDTVIIPYAFSAESTGLVGGLGYIKQGLFQPHTTLITSIMYGADEDTIVNGETVSDNFTGAFISFSNYKLPFTNRLFLSFIGLKSYFPNSVNYLSNGSNDSKKGKAIKSSGDSDFFNSVFSYMLPIGEGLANPEQIYKLKNGFAMHRENTGGGRVFETGFTALGLKTFYQYNSYENDELTSIEKWSTNGIRLFLEHENTDYNLNPSRGYNFFVQYSQDFGNGSSTQSWDFLELKYSHYFNLDTFSFTQQNVLALNAWTGYSFSWDNSTQIDAKNFIDANRPPPWESARLGGFSRMRAYDTDRFSDKAAIYATAEYRTILDWNPFRKNDYIPIAVDWFQLAAFVEVGRVNDAYDFDLLTDLKYDVGVSLRAMIAQTPVRFDIAYGEEGTNFWLMVYQPFDF